MGVYWLDVWERAALVDCLCVVILEILRSDCAVIVE